MTKERADLGFAEALNDLDLADFTPKPAKAAPPRPSRAATVRAAEAAGFKSREPRAAETQAAAPQKAQEADRAGQGGETAPRLAKALQPRRRRTGRNAQLNLKARPETIEAYCALADRMGWGLGETLEQAVALLEERYGRST